MTVGLNQNKARVSRYGTLPGELIDQVVETVTSAADPPGRSDVIYSLISEMLETLQWRYGPDDTTPDEVASLDRVLAEARAHQVRMSGFHRNGEGTV